MRYFAARALARFIFRCRVTFFQSALKRTGRSVDLHRCRCLTHLQSMRLQIGFRALRGR
jgi:hypothetical protein